MTDLTPFALQDAPALIEAVFPAQKVSFEAQRRKKSRFRTNTNRSGFLLERTQTFDSGQGGSAGQSAATDKEQRKRSDHL